MRNRGKRPDPRGKRRQNREWKVTRPDEKEQLARVLPQTREVKRLLEGIGTPHVAPFKPDSFQLEALAARKGISKVDVLRRALTLYDYAEKETGSDPEKNISIAANNFAPPGVKPNGRR